MPTARTYLAVDLGAESGRVILGRLEEQRLALAEAHRFANSPVQLNDGLHWDVLALWAQIKAGLAAGRQQAGEALAGIGLDTWGVDFALLDRNGALLGNPFHYRDARTGGMLEQAFRLMPREDIFGHTGIQFMQINTLYQLLALRLGRSPILDAAQTFLTIPDLFNYWLSGRIVAEFTNATTTQCYDPHRQDWAWPVLEALDIPGHIFPQVIRPGTLLGTLLPGVGAETGLADTPVIAPACHDTGSAVAAVPAESQDFAWISSGTWSIMGAETTNPSTGEQALRFNFTNEGGVAGTWRLSKNIMGLWLVQQCKHAWSRRGEALSYAQITQLATQARPFLAVIDPDSDTFLHPGDMPEKIRSFCTASGQPAPETQGEAVRVALESLALKYRFVLERLEQLVGKRLEPLHIIGGGTQNGLLNQFTANATGRAVVAGPVEATAIGNLLVQAMVMGDLASLDDAREVVRCSFSPQVYEPQDGAAWDDAYGRLLKVVQ